MRLFRELVVEGWRDLSARDAVLTAVLVVATALGASTSAVAFLSTVNYERQLIHAGTYVWEVEPVNDPTLRWRDCVNASQVAGVKASGGFVSGPTARYFYEASGADVPVLPVTADALWVWDFLMEDSTKTQSDDVTHGERLWIGRDLSETTGVGLGSEISAEEDGFVVSAGQVVATLPGRIPNAHLQSSLLVPAAPTRGLTGCWIRLERWSTESADAIIQASFGSQTVEVSRYRSPPLGPSANQRLVEDGGRRTWPILILLVSLVSAVVGWTQRSQVAVYRALGVSFTGLWWLRLVQSLVAVPFAIAGSLLIIAGHFALQGAGPPWWALPNLIRSPLLIILGSIAINPLTRLLAGWSNIQAALQDR